MDLVGPHDSVSAPIFRTRGCAASRLVTPPAAINPIATCRRPRWARQALGQQRLDERARRPCPLAGSRRRSESSRGEVAGRHRAARLGRGRGHARDSGSSPGDPTCASASGHDLPDVAQEAVAVHDGRGRVLDDPLLAHDALGVDEENDRFATIARSLRGVGAGGEVLDVERIEPRSGNRLDQAASRSDGNTSLVTERDGRGIGRQKGTPVSLV